MGEGQCWSVQGNGSRCAEVALPGCFFCDRHRYVNAAQVSRIWRAPEAEMPRELVAGLRRADPAITFPAAAFGASREVIASPAAREQLPAAAAPAAVPEGSGGSLPTEMTGAPLAWLLVVLRAATEGLMAGEATPLQKANAVSRLAGQYLKTYGAQERERENKALRRCLADAEAQVAALQARVAALEASVAAEREVTPTPDVAALLAESQERAPEQEESPGLIRLPNEEWVSLHEGERLAPCPAGREASSLAGAVTEGAGAPP